MLRRVRRLAQSGAAGGARDGAAAVRTRVLGGVVLREALVLEHVQQRGLPGVVEAEEEDLCILVGQACAREKQNKKLKRGAGKAV